MSRKGESYLHILFIYKINLVYLIISYSVNYKIRFILLKFLVFTFVNRHIFENEFYIFIISIWKSERLKMAKQCCFFVVARYRTK